MIYTTQTFDDGSVALMYFANTAVYERFLKLADKHCWETELFEVDDRFDDTTARNCDMVQPRHLDLLDQMDSGDFNDYVEGTLQHLLD